MVELAGAVMEAMGVKGELKHVEARNEVVHAWSDHSKLERIFGKRKKDIERERREAGKKAAEGGEPAAAATAATAVAEAGTAKDEAQESPADGAASEAKK